jgi:HlyD family secretion protein
MTLKLHPSTAPSRRTPRRAAIIVVLSIVGILVLSLWYLVQPLPLLVQGEADATLIDLAAQIDGRFASRSVHRGENVQSGQ